MDSWYDYLAMDALLPAAGWLVATIVGIHSLWSPNAPRRRLVAIFIYGTITIGVGAWYDYSGTQNLRALRETNKSIKTLLALSGVSNGVNINQGLDHLITRNIRPDTIIPTQEEELANSFYLIKDSLPKLIYLTSLPNGYNMQVIMPIERALARNDIKTSLAIQNTSSPQEVGLMFTMPDPSNPPDYALKLRDAFGVAGIRDIRFVRMSQDSQNLGFTIFIGPAPLK